MATHIAHYIVFTFLIYFFTEWFCLGVWSSRLFQTFLNTVLYSFCEILSLRVIYSRVCFGVWLPCGCYHKVSSGLSRIILLRLQLFWWKRVVKKMTKFMTSKEQQTLEKLTLHWYFIELLTLLTFGSFPVNSWKELVVNNIHMNLHQELQPSRAAFVDRLHHVQFSKAVPVQRHHQMRPNAAFISQI